MKMSSENGENIPSYGTHFSMEKGWFLPASAATKVPLQV